MVLCYLKKTVWGIKVAMVIFSITQDRFLPFTLAKLVFSFFREMQNISIPQRFTYVFKLTKKKRKISIKNSDFRRG